jgi:RsiW-degrading membrane proteinase PrsW (M82 family)
MSAQAIAPAAPARGLGTVAIHLTIAAISALGAIGLVSDLRVPLGIVPPVWVGITVAAWVLYGVVLLIFFVRPSVRAGLGLVALGVAIAWGALAATDIAGRANSAIGAIATHLSPDFEGKWTNWAIAPAVEETVKALGIMLLALLPAVSRFGARAGFLLGALVGVSFQVAENFVFTMQAQVDAPTAPDQALTQMLFIRGVLGIFSHIVYSGVIGAGIGWLASRGPGKRGRGWVVAIGTFILMVGLHSFSNWTTAIGDTNLYLVSMGMGLLALIVGARLSLRGPRATDGPPTTA